MCLRFCSQLVFRWWLVCKSVPRNCKSPSTDGCCFTREVKAAARRRASSDIIRDGDYLPHGKTPLDPSEEDAARRVRDASAPTFLPLPVIIYILIGLLAVMTADFPPKVKATTSERRREEQRGNQITDDGDGEGWEGTQIETPGERLERTVTSKIGRVKSRMNRDKRRWNRGVSGWEGTQPPNRDSIVCVRRCAK